MFLFDVNWMYVFEKCSLLLHSERCWMLCGMPGVFGVLHWLIQYLLEAKAPFAGVWLYPCGVCVLCVWLGWTNVAGRFWREQGFVTDWAWTSWHFRNNKLLSLWKLNIPCTFRDQILSQQEVEIWILNFTFSQTAFFSAVKVWMLLPQPRGGN